MSFKSIWGDIDVAADKIIPAKEEEKVKPEDTSKKGSENQEEEQEEEEEEGKGKPEGDDTPPADPKPKKEDENTTPTTYSEDDLNKTFELLDSQGVLDLDDEEEIDATPEGIASAVAASIRKGIQKELSSVPDAVRDLFNHIKEGKSASDFHLKDDVELWSEMDDEEEENQKLAVMEFLLSQGVDQEDLEEELEEIVEGGRLEKKAAIAFKALIKKDETTKKKVPYISTNIFIIGISRNNSAVNGKFSNILLVASFK